MRLWTKYTWPPRSSSVRDRRADHVLIELDDVRLDRQPIARRRLDHRHVADADQRHVQRPRNRRRRHRQHVDLLAQLLDALLVRHAEPLLFVDDEQAEIAKHDVLRQQSVRADDDVDLAGGERGDELLLLVRGPEPADHLDADREAREPLLQRPRVLKREHGGRREERDLLAVHHGLEGRAHRDFGLAVADVAAEQAIHRRRRLHVLDDVADRGLLVRRQVVLERVVELLLPVRVGAEGVARRRPCARRRASAAPRPCRAWPFSRASWPFPTSCRRACRAPAWRRRCTSGRGRADRAGRTACRRRRTAAP